MTRVPSFVSPKKILLGISFVSPFLSPFRLDKSKRGKKSYGWKASVSESQTAITIRFMESSLPCRTNYTFGIELRGMSSIVSLIVLLAAIGWDTNANEYVQVKGR